MQGDQARVGGFVSPIGWQDLAVDGYMYEWRLSITYVEVRRLGTQWFRIWTKEAYAPVTLDHVVRSIRKAVNEKFGSGIDERLS